MWTSRPCAILTSVPNRPGCHPQRCSSATCQRKRMHSTAAATVSRSCMSSLCSTIPSIIPIFSSSIFLCVLLSSFPLHILLFLRFRSFSHSDYSITAALAEACFPSKSRVFYRDQNRLAVICQSLDTRRNHPPLSNRVFYLPATSRPWPDGGRYRERGDRGPAQCRCRWAVQSVAKATIGTPTDQKLSVS